MTFLRVWQYDVAEGREAEFERMYAGDGPWARLFAHSDGFLGTELFRNVDAPRQYVTVDRFTSVEAWTRFSELYAAEYSELDRRGEGLTVSEREIATAGDG
jgi:heme-degrading monooxygenase HmoA